MDVMFLFRKTFQNCFVVYSFSFWKTVPQLYTLTPSPQFVYTVFYTYEYMYSVYHTFGLILNEAIKKPELFMYR